VLKTKTQPLAKMDLQVLSDNNENTAIEAPEEGSFGLGGVLSGVGGMAAHAVGQQLGVPAPLTDAVIEGVKGLITPEEPKEMEKKLVKDVSIDRNHKPAEVRNMVYDLMLGTGSMRMPARVLVLCDMLDGRLECTRTQKGNAVAQLSELLGSVPSNEGYSEYLARTRNRLMHSINGNTSTEDVIKRALNEASQDDVGTSPMDNVPEIEDDVNIENDPVQPEGTVLIKSEPLILARVVADKVVITNESTAAATAEWLTQTHQQGIWWQDQRQTRTYSRRGNTFVAPILNQAGNAVMVGNVNVYGIQPTGLTDVRNAVTFDGLFEAALKGTVDPVGQSSPLRLNQPLASGQVALMLASQVKDTLPMGASASMADSLLRLLLMQMQWSTLNHGLGVDLLSDGAFWEWNGSPASSSTGFLGGITVEWPFRLPLGGTNARICTLGTFARIVAGFDQAAVGWGPETWGGVATAVVPIQSKMLNSHSLIPWALSFMEYPFKMTGRNGTFRSQDGTTAHPVQATTAASLVRVPGPNARVLFVVVDAQSNVEVQLTFGGTVVSTTVNSVLPAGADQDIAPVLLGFYDTAQADQQDQVIGKAIQWWNAVYGNEQDACAAMACAADVCQRWTLLPVRVNDFESALYTYFDEFDWVDGGNPKQITLANADAVSAGVMSCTGVMGTNILSPRNAAVPSPMSIMTHLISNANPVNAVILASRFAYYSVPNTLRCFSGSTYNVKAAIISLGEALAVWTDMVCQNRRIGVGQFLWPNANTTYTIVSRWDANNGPLHEMSVRTIFEGIWSAGWGGWKATYVNNRENVVTTEVKEEYYGSCSEALSVQRTTPWQMELWTQKRWSSTDTFTSLKAFGFTSQRIQTGIIPSPTQYADVLVKDGIFDLKRGSEEEQMLRRAVTVGWWNADPAGPAIPPEQFRTYCNFAKVSGSETWLARFCQYFCPPADGRSYEASWVTIINLGPTSDYGVIMCSCFAPGIATWSGNAEMHYAFSQSRAITAGSGQVLRIQQNRSGNEHIATSQFEKDMNTVPVDFVNRLGGFRD
jgi:hypothetical protein